MISNQLRSLAVTLADWAAEAPGFTIYLFGSFVRGDNHDGSDVDIYIELSGSIDEDTVWWHTHNEETDYEDIKSKLPGPLKILHHDSTLVTGEMLRAARVVYSDRNVRCVWLPPASAKV
jgi:predicted nucleotidyltransferase